ncbi:hypothetical protein [Luteipulveratus flavus]|uniref:Uncharacterized protein n=1 Tax=Luteipulveratus flavus TaxID=3031728 RepID=A0ABT6C3S9_9MICO|nr:hypothetical protein [Luteipulveratus sp. YIM 133296]MDF8263614.1 hypothetical protein [Luteipulveratus sp. YIM 133296]
MRSALLAATGVAAGLLGLLLGSAPSGVEPDGLYVDCGRALFHDRDVLPHPACASAYEPFQTVSVVLLVVAAGLMLAAAVTVARRLRRRSSGTRQDPGLTGQHSAATAKP